MYDHLTSTRISALIVDLLMSSIATYEESGSDLDLDLLIVTKKSCFSS